MMYMLLNRKTSKKLQQRSIGSGLINSPSLLKIIPVLKVITPQNDLRLTKLTTEFKLKIKIISDNRNTMDAIK